MDHVHEVKAGDEVTDPLLDYTPGWYFWDETEADRFGPYATREVAEKNCEAYCREVLGQ